MWVVVVMFALAGVSGALALWQWWLARAFSFAPPSAPGTPAFAPSVSLLKPLSGVDDATEDCLRSWLAQEHPGPVEVLFGVSAADDPAVALCERLLAAHPAVDARVVVRPPGGGANSKAATLAHLESLARHEVLMASDADVRVPPGFLREVLEPLRGPGVVLVNCFYRLANPVTTALRWEAVAVNADFWSNVLQARALRPLDFALGAVMAMRRADLARAGGFVAVADYLADDYQLGRRLASLGGRIELSHAVVECHEAHRTWAAVWRHQLRWARTARTSRPVAYLFSILGNVTLWSLLAAGALWMNVSCGVDRHTETHPQPLPGGERATVEVNRGTSPGAQSAQAPLPSTGGVGGGFRAGDFTVKSSFSIARVPTEWIVNAAWLSLLALRLLTAQANHRRLSPATALWRWSWMVWVKDLLQAALWLAAFTGNRVTWRGRIYRVGRGGKLRMEVSV
jgi:ceramide glucosyltransferase